MHLPVYFDGQLLRCLIIGGGPSLLRKIELLLESGATVRLVAPQADFKIVVLASLSRVHWEQRQFQFSDDLEYDLVIIGSEDVPNRAELAMEFRRRNIPVNVCGEPESSTFFFPAILREGDLTVAVSSGGRAPFMAVEFIRRLSSAVKGWGLWLGLASRFRISVIRNTKDIERRKEYYEKFIHAGPIQIDPIPEEKTSIAEWLQILRHAQGGIKPLMPAVVKAKSGFVPRSSYSTGYLAVENDQVPPPDEVGVFTQETSGRREKIAPDINADELPPLEVEIPPENATE